MSFKKLVLAMVFTCLGSVAWAGYNPETMKLEASRDGQAYVQSLAIAKGDGVTFRVTFSDRKGPYDKIKLEIPNKMPSGSWVDEKPAVFPSTLFTHSTANDKTGTVTVTATFIAGSGTPAGGGPSATCSLNVGKWVSDKPIFMGSSGVQQVSPEGIGSKNLHYGGTGTPDTAKYKLVIGSDATDYDKNEATGEERDAGLDSTDVTWSVDPENAGTLTASGLTASFVPGAQVKQNIKITAMVAEGKKYSYTCQSYDARGVVSITGINTFKAGIKLTSGEDRFIWEDNAGAELAVPIGTSDFSAQIPWTGVFAEPGLITRKSSFPAAGKSDYGWVAIARTEGVDLTAVNGRVQFKPGITVAGKYRMRHTAAGLLPPGAGQIDVVKALADLSGNAYVKAAVDLSAAAAGTVWKHSWQGGIAGQCVIEFVDKKEFAYTYEDSTDDQWHDLSVLTIAGANLLKAPGSVVQGSVDIESLIAINDDSMTSESTMTITTSGGLGGTSGAATRVDLKCSKPVWVKN